MAQIPTQLEIYALLGPTKRLSQIFQKPKRAQILPTLDPPPRGVCKWSLEGFKVWIGHKYPHGCCGKRWAFNSQRYQFGKNFNFFGSSSVQPIHFLTFFPWLIYFGRPKFFVLFRTFSYLFSYFFVLFGSDLEKIQKCVQKTKIVWLWFFDVPNGQLPSSSNTQLTKKGKKYKAPVVKWKQRYLPAGSPAGSKE